MALIIFYEILLFIGFVQLVWVAVRSRRRVQSLGCLFQICVFLVAACVIVGTYILYMGITCKGDGCGALIVLFVPIFISVPTLLFSIISIFVIMHNESIGGLKCGLCNKSTPINYNGAENVRCKDCA